MARAVEPHESATRPGAALPCETPQDSSAAEPHESATRGGAAWKCNAPWGGIALRDSSAALLLPLREYVVHLLAEGLAAVRLPLPTFLAAVRSTWPNGAGHGGSVGGTVGCEGVMEEREKVGE